MITGVDHVVVLADALGPAARGFERLGFAVEPGGVHPAWGTENALIALGDGAYLEVLAPRPGAGVPVHRLWRNAAGGARSAGEYGGFALSVEELAGDVEAMRARGLEMTGPDPGRRERLDGRMVEWRLAFARAPELPFLIEDATPRALRIAPPQRGLNADTRLAEVTVVVPDLAPAAEAYRRLTGGAVEERPTEEGPAARVTTPRGRIVVLSPRPGTPARRHLDRAGPGVYAVALGVRRWAEITAALAALVRVEGGRATVSPEVTGGALLALEAW